MRNRNRFTRRALLKIFAIGGVFGNLVLKNAFANISQKNIIAEKLTSIVEDKEFACELGKRYLGAGIDAYDEKLLVNSIYINDPEKVEKIITADENQVLELVREMISDDFDNSKVVNIDGWILSRTELRVCALQHLTMSI